MTGLKWSEVVAGYSVLRPMADGQDLTMRIEYYSLSDDEGRCSFDLFWMADYHPGHPDGEYRTAETGQSFFADPREHGFKRPEEVGGG